jgi:hypothetical protein
MVGKLWNMLRMDGLTFKMLSQECLSSLRRNDNPIPMFKKWLTRNRISIPIYYVERQFKMDRDDVLNFVCGKPVPLILIMSVKKKGYHEDMDIRMVTLNPCKVDPDGIINYI